VGATLAVALLTGCSSASTTIQDALDQVHTAGSSVSLAADLNDGAGLPKAALDTSTVDAVAEISDAESTLAELEPAPSEADARDDALDRIRDVEDAVLAVQATGSRAARDALDSALDRLSE